MLTRGMAILALLLLPLAAAPPPPNEAEIRKSIEKGFREVYVDPVVWKITRITCEFGPVKLGRITQKQVQYGKAAEPVWPVKVEVTITQYRGDTPYRKITRGTSDSDIFLFYKDAFDEWKWKTGSL